MARARDPRISTLLDLGLEGPRAAPEVGGSERVGAGLHRAWRVRPAMGTVASVVAVDASLARAEDGIEAALAEMDRLVEILDRHDPATPLSDLNARGDLRSAPAELLEVVRLGLSWHHLTRGAFDITVQPLVDLFRDTNGAPGPAELAEATALVGPEKVRTAGRRITFDRSGMGLTLDGIAKGYVVDGMAEAVRGRGVRRFLVNAGGDIRASVGPEGGEPWTIGVRDPAAPDVLCDVVSLGNGAIATSGSYERPFPHLIDASRGRPARAATSVSACAGSAAAADALATALFVLGPTEGCRLAGRLAGCECLILDGAGRRARSPGWRGIRAEAGGS
jgi:FAD:protein FMN transferase